MGCPVSGVAVVQEEFEESGGGTRYMVPGT